METLEERGINENLIECIKSLYCKTVNYVRVKSEKLSRFNTKIVLRPLLFCVMLNKAIKKCKQKLKPFKVIF